METFKLKNGNTLKIYQDMSPSNPREDFDNMCEMYCFHRRYNLGDSNDVQTCEYESLEDIIEGWTLPSDIVVDLYLYDHGNLSISTSPYHCRWDSGKIGFAVIPVNTIVKEYGDDSQESREKALKCLLAEVKIYDQYLSGQCYGYVLEDAEGEEIDSCWGFYGYDHESSGLFETAGVQCKEELEEIA